MNPETSECLKQYNQTADDRIDAHLAWIEEKDPTQKKALMLAHKKLDEKCKKLSKQLLELTKKWEK